MKSIFSVMALSFIVCGALSAARPMDDFLGTEKKLPADLKSGPVEGVDTKGISFRSFDDKTGKVKLAVERERELEPVTFTVTGKKLAGRMSKKIKGEGEKQLVVRYMDKNGKTQQVVADFESEITLDGVVHVIAAHVGIPAEKNGAISVTRNLIKEFYKKQRSGKDKKGAFGRGGEHPGKKFGHGGKHPGKKFAGKDGVDGKEGKEKASFKMKKSRRKAKKAKAQEAPEADKSTTEADLEVEKESIEEAPEADKEAEDAELEGEEE